jgi:hypothetical protein
MCPLLLVITIIDPAKQVPYDLLAWYHQHGYRLYALAFTICYPPHANPAQNNVDYLPVYFQTAKGASQIRGGVDFLGVAFSVAPSVIVAGISIQATGRYAIQTWIGVIFGVVGFGLLSLLNVGSNEAKIIVFSFIEGIGVGIPFATTTYPILASVRIDQTATALSLLIFMRAFAYVGLPYFLIERILTLSIIDMGHNNRFHRPPKRTSEDTSCGISFPVRSGRVNSLRSNPSSPLPPRTSTSPSSTSLFR